MGAEDWAQRNSPDSANASAASTPLSFLPTLSHWGPGALSTPVTFFGASLSDFGKGFGQLPGIEHLNALTDWPSALAPAASPPVEEEEGHRAEPADADQSHETQSCPDEHQGVEAQKPKHMRRAQVSEDNTKDVDPSTLCGGLGPLRRPEASGCIWLSGGTRWSKPTEASAVDTPARKLRGAAESNLLHRSLSKTSIHSAISAASTSSASKDDVYCAVSTSSLDGKLAGSASSFFSLPSRMGCAFSKRTTQRTNSFS